MSSQQYDDLLKQVLLLPRQEQQRLIQALLNQTPPPPSNGKTLGDCMEERGLFGIASGPPDLSSNPKYMEGFGEDG